MKITFIMPCVGKTHTSEPYLKGWMMEPLAIAVLSALTPSHIEQEFFDDRCGELPYDKNTDLVAINVETYTAYRAYQIATRYRKLGVPVIMGGFHPTLVPDEAEQYADSILIGEAEPLWNKVLDDLSHGKLQTRYCCGHLTDLKKVMPNRVIYADKPYMKLSLVETSRGCSFQCDFCSITSFYRKSCRFYSVDDVICEIRNLPHRDILFVDDNIGLDVKRFRELLKALIPLNIRWSGQVSMHIAEDESLLALMKESGCQLVLIGFESLNPDSLNKMGKQVNRNGIDYDKYLGRFHQYGIAVYGTFVFGYESDRPEAFDETLAFAEKHKLFFAAMNHLVPFPGTVLYERLEREKRLLYNAWWLSDNYHFGQVAFQPESMQANELTDLSFSYRCKVYHIWSIIRRGLNFRSNCNSLSKLFIYIIGSFGSRKDVKKRQQLYLGIRGQGEIEAKGQ